VDLLAGGKLRQQSTAPPDIHLADEDRHSEGETIGGGEKPLPYLRPPLAHRGEHLGDGRAGKISDRREAGRFAKGLRQMDTCHG
jgi:hypothetical protein